MINIMQYIMNPSLFRKTFILSIFSFTLSGCDHWNKKAEPIIPVTSLNLTQKHALWSRFVGYNPDGYAVQLSTFTSDFNLLIVKQSKQILALETNQGHIQWRATTGYALTNPATTDKQKIFIATTEPRLLALHAHNGEMAWSVPLPNVVLAKACITEEYIIVKTIAGDVLAFYTKNGKPAWQYKHTGSEVMLHTSSQPILHQERIFVGFPDGKLVALNSKTGQSEWQHTVAKPKQGKPFSQLVDIAADPQVEGDTLYINAYQGKLQALSTERGEIKWEVELSTHSALVLGQYIYTITDQNKVMAFDKDEGKLIWEQPLLQNRHLTGPLLTPTADYLIIADDQGTLYWLSQKTGDIVGKATFTIASPVLNKPLAHHNKVYAITRRGQIVAWQYPEIIPQPKALIQEDEETVTIETEKSPISEE
jgi:outer membrane protein assembly factor BamB